VFISADGVQMDVVERAGLVSPGSRITLAGNRLVVVVHGSRPTFLQSIRELVRDDVRRIAIGDPAAVPAGVYAKSYLERIGLWETLARKMVPSTNVRAALAAVQNGSAEAAFVYATDARTASGLRVAVVVSGPESPRISYPACMVKTTRYPASASRFLQFLRSPVAVRIFEHHGFIAPPAIPVVQKLMKATTS
jgi:molybdate transport system substrate-binding protein